MKKLIVVLGILTAGILIAAGYTRILQSNKTFTISDTGTDTTSTVSLLAYTNVELAYMVTGCDSMRTDIYVDCLVGTKWVTLVTDSLKITAAGSDHARGILLRGYGTNKIPGIEQIRVRIQKQSGDVGDSVSALKYNLYLIER